MPAKAFNWQIGPATIAVVLSFLGSVYYFGGQQAETKATLQDIRSVIQEVQRSDAQKARAIADQDTRVGRVETAVTFITSAVSRIENKLDGSKP